MFNFHSSHLRYLAIFILILVTVIGFGSAANVTFNASAQEEIGYGAEIINDFEVTAVDYTLDAGDPRANADFSLTFSTPANEVRAALVASPGAADWITCVANSGGPSDTVWNCNTPPGVQVVDMTNLHVVATYDNNP